VSTVEELHKYKQMWKEFEKIRGFWIAVLPTSRNLPNIQDEMEDIKLKYFPKAFKKTIKIEIETNKFDDIAFGIKTIGNIIDDISGNSGIPEMKIIKDK